MKISLLLVNEDMSFDEVTQRKYTEKDENLALNFENQYLKCVKRLELYG